MDFRKVLRKTKYKDKIDFIMRFFENAGIDNYDALQNAPGSIGHLPNIDIYDLVKAINDALVEDDPLSLTKIVVDDQVVEPSKAVKRIKKNVTDDADADSVLEKGDENLPNV